MAPDGIRDFEAVISFKTDESGPPDAHLASGRVVCTAFKSELVVGTEPRSWEYPNLPLNRKQGRVRAMCVLRGKLQGDCHDTV